jgi:hypothetical protein
MREIVEIAGANVVPESDAVYACLSVPVRDEKIEYMLREAVAQFGSLSSPAGIYVQIDAARFEALYRGEGKNEPSIPLQTIFPRADRLALFAATVGPAVSVRLTELFDRRDFALGSMLDAVASEATEVAAEIVERTFRARLMQRGELSPSAALLRYSPGYCGWHVSAQRALFDVLRPEEIGITLRESFLMEPLKSISGVIVAGPAEIHDFEDDYPFCAECQTRSCRDRIRHVKEG